MVGARRATSPQTLNTTTTTTTTTIVTLGVEPELGLPLTMAYSTGLRGQDQ